MEYTHRLAVIAYVIFENRFLLMKRTTPPVIWGPPGGRLGRDEDPNEGVLREVREETGLNIQIIGPADVWHGPYGKTMLSSVDYLAVSDSDRVALSAEHSEYRWSTIEDLRVGLPPLEKEPPGFLLKDFEKAWNLFLKLK